MLWKEIKTWATSHGYSVDRTKVKDSENSYNYVWSHPEISGTANSTFNLAKDIYNHMSSGHYLSYQFEYSQLKSYDSIHSQQSY